MKPLSSFIIPAHHLGEKLGLHTFLGGQECWNLMDLRQEVLHRAWTSASFVIRKASLYWFISNIIKAICNYAYAKKSNGISLEEHREKIAADALNWYHLYAIKSLIDLFYHQVCPIGALYNFWIKVPKTL